jgi:hypothetical protein
MPNRYDNSDIRSACPGKGGLLHEGFSSSGTQAANTTSGGPSGLFAALRKAVGNSVGPSGVMGQNSVHQKALYPHLSDTVRRPM